MSTNSVATDIPTMPATGMPVDARGLALAVLAVLAVIYTLSWAQPFVVPLLLGIVISYTLNPVVTWLEALRLPRVLATVIVMASVIGALGLGTYSLRGQVQTIIEQLPEVSAKFAAGLARMQVGQTGNLQKVQSAAAAMEKAATQAAGGPAAPRPAATHVIVDTPTFQAEQFPLAGLDRRAGCDGRSGDGRVPGLLPAAGRRYIQAQARAADGSVAGKAENHRPDPRRHQRFDPEIHVHAVRDQRARRAAELDRVQLDRTRECGGLGRRGRPVARDSLPGTRRHGRGNGDGRVHAVRVVRNGAASSPARRWQSPPSSAPSSPPGWSGGLRR